jgi:hypothetical protein
MEDRIFEAKGEPLDRCRQCMRSGSVIRPVTLCSLPIDAHPIGLSPA